MVDKKKFFTLSFIKKFLNKKGLELFNKSNHTKSNSSSLRSFSYTAFVGIILVLTFFFGQRF